MRRALVLSVLVALAVVPAAAHAFPARGACEGAIPVAPEALGLPDLGGERAAACVGKIQPGARLSNGCTASWIVRDETGALYVATAGHCVGRVGDRMGVTGVGEMGTVAFTMNAGVGRDFALLRIDASKYDRVEPSLCHWGGPTGVATFAHVDAGERPDVLPPWIGGGVKRVDAHAPLAPAALLHYGWGAYANAQPETRARVGWTASVTERSLTNVGNYNPGDSGSPIMFADGSVAGVVTHSFLAPGRVDVRDPTTGDVLRLDNPYGGLGMGVGFATRFDHGLAVAGAATGHVFTLVTSEKPVLVTAVLEG